MSGRSATLWGMDPRRDPDPVDLRHEADHAFVKREKKNCAECNRGPRNPLHVGVPQSLNAFGSGSQHAFQNQKHAWERRLTELLVVSGLPKGLGSVHVRGQMCFPTRIPRDQGNFRFLIEKALGDALEEGGWLDDDSWSRYTFGDLDYAYAKGESWMALTLFPSWTPMGLDDGRGEEQLTLAA